MAFVHLRTHTEFSVVDGTLRIDEAAAAAAQDRQVALAITDLGNLFGAVKFYGACRAQGVKPLIGADLWIEPDNGADRTASRLLVLVQNARGYLNLCELLAHAWTGNVNRAQAWVKWAWLAERHEGLIVLSGAEAGALGQALLADDAERARALAERYRQTFGNRFYVEIQRAGLPQQEAHVQAALLFAAQQGLPVVATHPVQFLASDDFEAHEARVCVAEGETLTNPKRIKRFTPEQYFKTQDQMQALFADVPAALQNSVLIAQRCNLSLVLGRPQLPDFPTPLRPDGARMPIAEYFRQASLEGLERRLEQLYPDKSDREGERSQYEERLEFEINTILKMGFPGYFLIVSDFIQWAKSNGCPVGPGRGSGAGSLVAYALSITDLDPLRYGLLFERFLNPERVSMPDFDVDFCQANRDRVIEYVKDKYGREAVSQIATFGTMAAKAALRDVGRVLGMGYGHVDSIAKLIPAPPGKTVTLAKAPDKPDSGIIYARLEAPELEQREAAEEEVAELLALAARVEGMVRNVGMHAGGVLIAPGKITDFCPLYQQPGSDSAVSQYDKDDVEAIGLVKFDFLGLATLTILELARDFIVARRPERANFRYETLPLDDARVYKLFAEGLTEAVFQFESRGMQAMLRDAKPTRLEDLIALNAMFRPGPMENIPSFCARKHGREPITYPHALLEKVLAETYGIFVYQEQVMQAAQLMGGYSLGGADLLRRAMGKKKPEEMAQHREIFRKGAADKGISAEKANEVFDLMEKFAGYGFNKSHAAAYSLLAYHTGWLKVHCTAEFFAANMTIELDDTDKLKVLRQDAVQNFGIAFDPPDINHGTWRFEPVPGREGDRRIRYGLSAVKGTGRGAIEAIVAARDGTGAHEGQGAAPFKSLFDFAARVDRSKVNKRVVEALIKAGAFDALHPDRARALASVALAFEWADDQQANALQGGLFDFGDTHGSSMHEPELVEVSEWSIRERLMAEKNALGFYISGHLFEEHADEVRRFVPRRIAELTDARESVLLAGIVGEIKVVNSQRGRLGIFRLDDQSEAIEAVVDERLLDVHKERLKEDELVIVQGKLQPDRHNGGMRLNVQQVFDLPTARARFGRYLTVTVEADSLPVREVLALWPPVVRRTDEGDTLEGLRVRVRVQRSPLSAAGQAALVGEDFESLGVVGEVDLGDAARFWPADEALARWCALAYEGQAAIVY
ncbi:MAG: DNA polymerase III subunit alpha [Betaproteobacteria bacterium]|nr:DNA polymerase III subunit alpha [Betaproteobacteria bacterium]